ncbi:MAG: aspartate aminotransferase family protein [Proteobacteria bacterium]|nr:aspartate aminotransferase family protein [Pseudomonadota bacterium]
MLPNAGSRSSIQLSPYTLFLKSGQGKKVVDVDGNELIDFNNNYTSLIHGHCHPYVVEAVNDQIRKGTAFAFGSEIEIKLAELLCDRVPGFEQIRFMNSGTEAVMNGIKVARAITGRAKIAKCENAYHGSYDASEVSLAVEPTDLSRGDPVSKAYSAGTPQGVLNDVVVIPFNDVPNCRRILNEHGPELAGVLFDPFGSGMGRLQPTQEFIDLLDAMRDAHGLLLIADEVIAFRADYRGCMDHFGVKADITCLGKIIGGGFPVGAVAGSRNIMGVFDGGSEKARLPHGGTFNANPVTMVAGEISLRELTAGRIEQMNRLRQMLQSGLNDIAQKNSLPLAINHYGSCLNIFLSESIPDSPIVRADEELMDRFHVACLNHGLFIAPRGMVALSTVITEEDIAAALESADAAMRDVAAESG